MPIANLCLTLLFETCRSSWCEISRLLRPPHQWKFPPHQEDQVMIAYKAHLMKTNNWNLQSHKFKLKIEYAAERIHHWILDLGLPPNQSWVSEEVFGHSLSIKQSYHTNSSLLLILVLIFMSPTVSHLSEALKRNR